MYKIFFHFVVLALLVTLGACGGGKKGLWKKDSSGSYQLYSHEGNFNFSHNDYSVFFSVSEKESSQQARHKMELRAHRICGFLGYLITDFSVREFDSQYMASGGGNVFMTYNKKRKMASASLVCEPTEEEISKYSIDRAEKEEELSAEGVPDIKNIELFEVEMDLDEF